MKDLICDRVPRKYTLLWDPRISSLIIRIHKSCLPLRPIPATSPWVTSFRERFQIEGLFDSFSGDTTTEYFGYNNSIKKSEDQGEYLDFMAKLPVIRQLSSRACRRCNGSKFYHGVTCHTCDPKTGREIEHVWPPAYYLTGSLSLLFNVLDMEDVVSTAPEEQHLVVSGINTEQGGSGLGGGLSIPIMEYLKKNPGNLHLVLRETEESMYDAWSHMMGENHHDKYYIRAWSEEGSFSLVCPGQGCGINLTHTSFEGEGAEFGPHNVDNPAQALTLLAGLAVMTNTIENELKTAAKPVAA